MKTTANRSGSYARPFRSGLLMVAVFLAVAVAILGIVAINEQTIASHEQELAEQRPVESSSLLKELSARERELLDTVAVIDSAAGVYRIPIERAMELVANEATR